MKRLIMWIAILWGSAGSGISQTFTNLTSLPIGGANALIAHLEKEVSRVEIYVTITNHTTSDSWGGTDCTTNYSSSMGPLSEFLQSFASNVFNHEETRGYLDTNCTIAWTTMPVFTTNDNGQGATFNYELSITPPGSTYPVGLSGPAAVVPLTFTIAFTNGVCVVPPRLLAWPWVDWFPISGARTGVLWVNDQITNREPFTLTSDNGYSYTVQAGDCRVGVLASGCPDGRTCDAAHGLTTNNVIYLYMQDIGNLMVDVTNLYHMNATPPVVSLGGIIWLTYGIHTTNGADIVKGRDGFDVGTGQKVCPSPVNIAMVRTNGAPCIDVTCAPGLQVWLETSSDLRHWSLAGSVWLDESSEALFVPTNSGLPLFVRGRQLVP